MDPSGGWFGKIFIAIVALLIAIWLFAPHAWAIGSTIALGAAFVIFVIYILSTARFT